MAKGFAKGTKKKSVNKEGYYSYVLGESPKAANKRLGSF